MACDLQATKGTAKFMTSTKIIELEGEKAEKLFNTKRVLIGHSGLQNDFGRVMTFLFTENGKPPRIRDSDFLLLCKEGIFHSSDFEGWNKVEEKSFSIGSGSHFALGALASGATPLEACKIAGKKDIYTGIGYKEYIL